MSESDLIPPLVDVLRRRGGRARKGDVEQEMYRMFHDLFEHPYYQEKVARGIPRWKHYVAWARNKAREDGLIRPTGESGWGYWELTEGAMRGRI